MKNFSVRTTCVVLCAGLSLSFSINTFAFEATELTNKWLTEQLSKHPDIIAANESMNAVFSKTAGSNQPLYNPELTTGYEREGDGNNFVIGINQTIDLWDKKENRIEQRNYSLTAASKRFTYTVEKKTAQALQALIKWQAAKNRSQLAFQQEKELEILLDIVIARKNAGDLGQVDAELTFLNLSQLLGKTAQVQAEFKVIQSQVKELLPDWTPETQSYPVEGLGVTNLQVSEQWISEHPVVLEAKALWQIKKAEAQYALLETKADPTIGLSAGKNDRENIVGVTFSMPLNIRNDYSSNAKAANQQANSEEANFQSIYRKQKYIVKASTDSLISNKKYLNRWLKLMNGRAESSAQLLQKQWQLGDLNTSQYLLALQQRAEGLYAGIELQAQFKLSEVEWLLNVGQLIFATKNLK